MDLVGLLQEFWNNYGQPIFQNLQLAIENTGAIFQAWWDNFLKPVFDAFMEAISEIWDEHLSTFIQNFLELVGELVNAALELYNRFVVPIKQWFAEHLGPVFASVFKGIIETVSNAISNIIDFVSGLITILKGIVQFMVGVFTGDWEKAWTGIKNIFKGVFDSLVAFVKTPVNQIIDIINGMVSGVVSGINTVIKAINNISFDMPDWLGGGHVGFSLKTITATKIPKLAQGGFVKANTPQLAIIGDNRHQGEVVAPEDKLREMAVQAVREAGAGGIRKEDLERIINNAVMRIVSALYELGFNIDGEMMAKAEKLVKQGLDRRYNNVEIG
jgi:hypothetical protein